MNLKTLSTTILSLCLLLICSHSAQAQCDEHKALLDLMERASAEKNASLLDQVYHENAVRHSQNGKEEGLTLMKKNAEEFYKNIPDAVGKNIDVICQGNKLVARWTGEGTPNGAPKKVKVTGITIYEIKDGKIIEEWEEMSMLSLMMQMGYKLTPPEGAGGN